MPKPIRQWVISRVTRANCAALLCSVAEEEGMLPSVSRRQSRGLPGRRHMLLYNDDDYDNLVFYSRETRRTKKLPATDAERWSSAKSERGAEEERMDDG